MNSLIQQELGGWMAQADSHWQEHCPNMYRDLLEAGQLSEALEQAANQTALEMDQMMDAGFSYQDSWDSVRQSYLILPEETTEEDQDEEEPNLAYEIMCDLIKLNQQVSQTLDELNDRATEPYLDGEVTKPESLPADEQTETSTMSREAILTVAAELVLADLVMKEHSKAKGQSK